jgi:hypothetical protein
LGEVGLLTFVPHFKQKIAMGCGIQQRLPLMTAPRDEVQELVP